MLALQIIGVWCCLAGLTLGFMYCASKVSYG